MTAHELAERTQTDPTTIQQQLETLEDLGYLELQHRSGEPPRAWLTIKGVDLVYETEAALLSSSAR
jgi:predicted transcriptional regulator